MLLHMALVYISSVVYIVTHVTFIYLTSMYSPMSAQRSLRSIHLSTIWATKYHCFWIHFSEMKNRIINKSKQQNLIPPLTSRENIIDSEVIIDIKPPSHSQPAASRGLSNSPFHIFWLLFCFSFSSCSVFNGKLFLVVFPLTEFWGIWVFGRLYFSGCPINCFEILSFSRYFLFTVLFTFWRLWLLSWRSRLPTSSWRSGLPG